MCAINSDIVGLDRIGKGDQDNMVIESTVQSTGFYTRKNDNAFGTSR